MHTQGNGIFLGDTEGYNPKSLQKENYRRQTHRVAERHQRPPAREAETGKERC